VILVNLAVLTLFVGLATLQFDSINSGLVGERLLVLAGRTAAPFRAAAKIGLPLSTVRNADALLERARQTDDAILAIHVFDETGRIVHSTDASAPASIAPEALAAREAAAGAPWHNETERGFLSSIDIPARADATAGGILIVYPGGGDVIAVRRTTFELPILHGNRLVGGITVEISPLFVQTRLRNVFLDVLVLALIATLVALELALAVAVTSVGKPLDRIFHLLGEQGAGNFLYRISGPAGSAGSAASRRG
jgi:hypothetical protein